MERGETGKRNRSPVKTLALLNFDNRQRILVLSYVTYLDVHLCCTNELSMISYILK